MDNKSRTWAEIDLAAIKHNLANVKKLLKPDVLLLVTVKADAYGHGMVEVARTAIEAGAGFLGVATLEEAMALREAQIKTPILVLGFVPHEYAKLAVENDISLTVFDYETAGILSRVSDGRKKAKIHIKLDTGMGRIGFIPGPEAIRTIVAISQLPGIEIEGLFTHFAVSDIKDKGFTCRQLDLYQQMAAALAEHNIRPKLRHVANSAAIMEMPETQLDMVRAGIITYGLYPSNQVDRKKIELVPAMRLKSRVTLVKTLPRGYSVSYGRTFTSAADMQVATVGVGYADGYNRRLSNRAWAVIRGHRVPLIGTVCMDQCMFDVSGVEGVKPGDEITLFGRPEDGVTADDLAGIIGTINYEVVCLITARVPRVYI